MNILSIPNPALMHLTVLEGQWRTVGTHPLVPDITLHGQVHSEWIEGGAYLRMHSVIDNTKI